MARKTGIADKLTAASAAAKPPDSEPKTEGLNSVKDQLTGLAGSFENLLAQRQLKSLSERRDLQNASVFVRNAQTCLDVADKAQLELPPESSPPAEDSASTFLPQLSSLKASLGDLILNGQIRGAKSQYYVAGAIDSIKLADEWVRKAYKIPTDTSAMSSDQYPDALSADTTDIIELEARISSLRSQLASMSEDVAVLQDRFRRVLAKSPKRNR